MKILRYARSYTFDSEKNLGIKVKNESCYRRIGDLFATAEYLRTLCVSTDSFYTNLCVSTDSLRVKSTLCVSTDSFYTNRNSLQRPVHVNKDLYNKKTYTIKTYTIKTDTIKTYTQQTRLTYVERDQQT